MGVVVNLKRAKSITIVMYFDLHPKEKPSDFYNYAEELSSLVKYITNKSTRMIVISGLRRTGKSSLLRVGLGKAKQRFTIIDARDLQALTRRSFEVALLEKVKTLRGLPATLLEKIESIEFGVRVSIKQKEDLWRLLKTLNPVIAIDEVQMLKGTGVEAFLASAYDNTNCKIVLTGSEVGVLDSFMGNDDPKAHLFGRDYEEIKMHPLAKSKSEEFLYTGFEQAGKKITGEKLAEAVEELDGIVGWLAMFGNNSLSHEPEVALKKTMKKAAMLAYSEVESFLQNRQAARSRYLSLLRAIAKGESKWAELKKAVEISTNQHVNDSQFANYLNSLVSYGFVVANNNGYSIPDPMLKKALRGGTSNYEGVVVK